MDKAKIIDDLKNLIKIESVSTDSERFDQILEAVRFLKEKLEGLGFRVKTRQKNNQPPLIVASRIVSSEAKTIAVYGHYDVQPEDPVEEWQSPPFELTVKNGKIYGRGTADNKGSIIQNIAAVEELVKNKKLKNNVIFILEGEEESGSVNFEEYISEAAADLAGVDVFFLTDVGLHGRNIPQIFYGLRGLIYFELELEIGEHDLHSGIYGNRVYNPLQVLSDIFVKIKDVNTGKINIPHFYDVVRKPESDEIKLLEKAAVSDKAIAREAKVDKVLTTGGDKAYLSSKIHPSFEINGMIGGYTGKGSKTIIPRSAQAKFSFRLVEHQKAKEVEQQVREFIKNHLPEGVRFRLTVNSKADPFYTSINNDFVKKTAGILTDFFGNETLFNRSGGSVPAAEVLSRRFQKPVILTGFTLPDDNIHAPNENFDEEMFWKGIEVLVKIYREEA
jgi:acetylornithine deacetylase/succinyl-diaminopimelate desuccinylase-like protein